MWGDRKTDGAMRRVNCFWYPCDIFIRLILNKLEAKTSMALSQVLLVLYKTRESSQLTTWNNTGQSIHGRFSLSSIDHPRIDSTGGSSGA